MSLSEYNSKELLAQYGVTIPEGRLAHTDQEAEERARGISAPKYVVKAQIGAGGRGLAGGIKFAATPNAVRQEAKKLIGSTLVTEQTGEAGEVVPAVYVEAAQEIEKDFFVAIVLDPETAEPTLLASAQGGVQFEQMARMDPDVVRSLAMPVAAATDPAEVASFLEGVGFPKPQEAAKMLLGAMKAFVENDMSLLEINPLAMTAGGDWIAVDAKVTLDSNAMFRHPELESIMGDLHMTSAEKIAQENEINLVKLTGNIGVVVNGAGLGLATNDMIVDAGGKPANFMDIRTTASSFDIAKGVELLVEDKNVKVILLNVHGGGMTVCDTVVEGLAFAYSRATRKPPIVARLAGQGAEWAHRILKERRLPVETFENMTDAAKRAVEVATKGAF